MILEAKNIKPFIHLGFSKQSITVESGIDVTVWQDKLYNQYTPAIDVGSGTIVSLGSNKTIVNFSTSGTYNVKMIFLDKDKNISLESNEVIINIITPS